MGVPKAPGNHFNNEHLPTEPSWLREKGGNALDEQEAAVKFTSSLFKLYNRIRMSTDIMNIS